MYQWNGIDIFFIFFFDQYITTRQVISMYLIVFELRENLMRNDLNRAQHWFSFLIKFYILFAIKLHDHFEIVTRFLCIA